MALATKQHLIPVTPYLLFGYKLHKLGSKLFIQCAKNINTSYRHISEFVYL